MTDVDAHSYLILHHLHKFAERRIFRWINHVVLSGGVLSICITIVYHISYQANLQQTGILGHLAEFESELLRCCVIEVRAEICGPVDT